MIITVTMNPAIDKTVEIETLVPGGVNRISKVEYDAGGKGINVSKTICELGGESIATGFLGGNAGKAIVRVLNDKQIKNDFIWVDGETRTNTKVFEQKGAVTELNEPGPDIKKEQIEALLKKLEDMANENTMVVLAGSIPKGVEKNIYAVITERVHAKGAKVLMDADGELFQKALEAGPDIIKPNRDELEAYAGLSKKTSQVALLAQAEKLKDKGIESVVISMGKSGALFSIGNKKANCKAVEVKAHSTVGAGDAMVAALSYAWDKNLSEEETIRLCMATSAGAVTTVGTKPPKKSWVDELQEKVDIEWIVC